MQNLPPSDPARLRLLAESYQRLTRNSLLSKVATDDTALATAVWQAPFAIVAHGTETDPIFFYGNRYAQLPFPA